MKKVLSYQSNLHEVLVIRFSDIESMTYHVDYYFYVISVISLKKIGEK